MNTHTGEKSASSVYSAEKSVCPYVEEWNQNHFYYPSLKKNDALKTWPRKWAVVTLLIYDTLHIKSKAVKK